MSLLMDKLQWWKHSPFFFCLFCLFAISWAAPVACGGSQGRVESELQPPAYATATAMQDPRRICNLHHSNAGSSTHGASPGIKPATSRFLVGFVNHWATMRTPKHSPSYPRSQSQKLVSESPVHLTLEDTLQTTCTITNFSGSRSAMGVRGTQPPWMLAPHQGLWPSRKSSLQSTPGPREQRPVPL